LPAALELDEEGAALVVDKVKAKVGDEFEVMDGLKVKDGFEVWDGFKVGDGPVLDIDPAAGSVIEALG
jgi:hypothetical protein